MYSNFSVSRIRFASDKYEKILGASHAKSHYVTLLLCVTRSEDFLKFVGCKTWPPICGFIFELSYYEQTLVSSPGPTQSTGEPNVRDIAIACKVAAAILFHKIISFVRAPKVQTFYWLN